MGAVERKGSRRMKRIVCDLDGTLCTQESSDNYRNALPIPGTISRLAELKAAGWHVIIYTARGMNTYGTARGAEDVHRGMTEEWLAKNGIEYDELIFGKPAADVYVDDKGMNVVDFIASDI